MNKLDYKYTYKLMFTQLKNHVRHAFDIKKMAKITRSYFIAFINTYFFKTTPNSGLYLIS